MGRILESTISSAQLLEENLRVLEEGELGVRNLALQLPENQLAAAQAWIIAGATASEDEAKAAYGRAETYARSVSSLSPDAIESDLCSRALFLLGNAIGGRWLTMQTFPKVSDGEVESIRGQLRSAREAFELAIENSQIGSPLKWRAPSQLAKTLTAQYVVCGDSSCLELAKDAWRRAIFFADDAEKQPYIVNLCGVILSTLKNGTLSDIKEAELMLEKLEKYTESTEHIRQISQNQRKYISGVINLIKPHYADDNYISSIATAKNDWLRREYLTERIPQLPDYSERRADKFTGLKITILSDLAKAIIAGLPQNDPIAFRNMQGQASSIREINEGLSSSDRERYNAVAGKAFVLNHLEEGSGFALVLRSYHQESYNINEPRVNNIYRMSDCDSLHSGKLHVTVSRISKQVITKLSECTRPLLIMNVNDLSPDDASLKLYAQPDDWKTLVFSLSVQAEAIIFFVPNDIAYFSRGISDELSALQALKILHKVIIIMTNVEIWSEDHFTNSIPADPLKVRSALASAGFVHFYDEEGLSESLEEIVDVVRSLQKQVMSE